MKRLIILLLLSVTALSYAQKEQDPDTLLWNNRRYLIVVHRDVPNIVQVYFQRTRSDIPFNHWSSNNNRGHVATFEILDNSLFLNAIEAKRFKTRRGNLWAESGIDTSASPVYFGIKPLHSFIQLDNAIPCDWFSGIVELAYIPRDKKDAKSEEAQGHRYLQVLNGEIVENMLITNDDRKRLDADPSRVDLKDKQAMLMMQQRFLQFYIRHAYDRETVSFQGHNGLFEHKANSLSIAMEMLGNNPLASTVNYTNSVDVNGSLFGSYMLDNDSLYLIALYTHSGSDPFRYDSSTVEYVDGLPLFASWVDGEYVIQYGSWITNDFGVPTYNVERTQKLRLNHGVVASSQFSPKGFDDAIADDDTPSFAPCNPNAIYAVDYNNLLSDAVGKYKSPKHTPEYEGGKVFLRNYYANHSLKDPRAKERLFRVVIAFMVNCSGETGQWQIISKGKGELAEYANMVLEITKGLPRKWTPARDRKGNPVDCWQIIEFTVSNGDLSNANYR